MAEELAIWSGDGDGIRNEWSIPNYSAQDKPPTAEDQMKVRDIIYKHIPEIRERIFS